MSSPFLFHMERPANLEFSERLKGAMKRAELKGKDLAEALSVSPNTVTDWRNGAYLPEGERLTKLAKALSVTDRWLIYGDRPTAVAEGLSTSELRGYAIAVRDMLENARILQQRVIDGLSAQYPLAQPSPVAGGKQPGPAKDPVKVQKARARHAAERPAAMAEAEAEVPSGKQRAAGT